uniref:Uncharacterized protein n=1 Tax=Wuchereria bancrofti TaxID=6293 RepID=A0AAF5Q085_WUCBA
MVSYSIYHYIIYVEIERRFIYGEYFSDRSRKPFSQC